MWCVKVEEACVYQGRRDMWCVKGIWCVKIEGACVVSR